MSVGLFELRGNLAGSRTLRCFSFSILAFPILGFPMLEHDVYLNQVTPVGCVFLARIFICYCPTKLLCKDYDILPSGCFFLSSSRFFCLRHTAMQRCSQGRCCPSSCAQATACAWLGRAWAVSGGPGTHWNMTVITNHHQQVKIAKWRIACDRVRCSESL